MERAWLLSTKRALDRRGRPGFPPFSVKFCVLSSADLVPASRDYRATSGVGLPTPAGCNSIEPSALSTARRPG